MNIGARVETEEVIRILASSTNDLLHLSLLDLKLSKMNLQMVKNQNQMVLISSLSDAKGAHQSTGEHLFNIN